MIKDFFLFLMQFTGLSAGELKFLGIICLLFIVAVLFFVYLDEK
jgi:hypothetical protein